MPTVNTYEKPAGEICKGDYLFGHKVTGVDPKRVNVVVIFDEPVNGEMVYTFKKTDLLEVGIEELTVEELEAKRLELIEFEREHFVQTLRKDIAGAAQARAKAVQTIVEDSWLRYHMVDELITSDVTASYYGLIEDYLDRGAAGTLFKNADEPRESCEWDGAVAVVETFTNMLFQDALRFRHRSQSTSQMSNYMDMAKFEALGTIIGSWRYALPKELRHLVPDRY